MKKLVKKPANKDEMDKLKRAMAMFKKESNEKIKRFESQVKSQAEDLQRKGEEI